MGEKILKRQKMPSSKIRVSRKAVQAQGHTEYTAGPLVSFYLFNNPRSFPVWSRRRVKRRVDWHVRYKYHSIPEFKTVQIFLTGLWDRKSAFSAIRLNGW